MTRVVFNDAELDALKGLPLAARVAYMEGVRPYMDYVTGVVGAVGSRSKSISLQSIAEVLYVEPKPGRLDTGSRSRKQARGCIEVLIDAGLLASMSVAHKAEKRLILKCLLADTDQSVQNKQGTIRAHYQGTIRAQNETSTSNGLDGFTPPKQGIAETPYQGTPPEAVIKNTTNARAREACLIPGGFSLNAEVRLRLQTGGVRLAVAEYFLDEFKAEAESRGSVSFNWPAELVKYCKRWEWRYDKEQSANNGGNRNQSITQNRASRVHQSLKDEYAKAIAEEQGDQAVQSVSGEVRSQVVVPYRRPGVEGNGYS